MSDENDGIYKTITLRRTIKDGQREYTQLDLKPPTIGQRRRCEGSFRQRIDVESQSIYNIQLVSLVSGAPQTVVEQMDADQFEEAATFLQGFTDRGRATGSSSAST